MIVVDTNVVSELMRPDPHPRVKAWSFSHAPDALFASAVTEAELRHGLAKMPGGARRDDLARRLEAVFARLLAGRVLAFDRAAAAIYAEFMAARRAAGRPVLMPDAMIAATARARGASLIATRDGRGFEGCGVPVLDPWRA